MTRCKMALDEAVRLLEEFSELLEFPEDYPPGQLASVWVDPQDVLRAKQLLDILDPKRNEEADEILGPELGGEG